MNNIAQGKITKSTKKLPIIILAAAGICLIILSQLQAKKADSTNYTSSHFNDVNEYQAALEQKLIKTINTITDGNCSTVMITLDGGFENVYAPQTDTVQQSLFSKSNESTLTVLKTKNPKIAGVAIVCSNIYDAQSVIEIKKAAATCLNINENKIYIIGGTISQ